MEFYKKNKKDIQKFLYIEYDLLSYCNFKCSYCFANKFYKQLDDWGKEEEENKTKTIVNCIALSKLPVHMMILGGEPSQHSKFIELMHYILTRINRPNDKITLVTNGTFKMKDIDEILHYDNLEIIISVHFEHAATYGYNIQYSTIMKKIKKIIDSGTVLILNIMIPDGDKNRTEIISFLNIIKQYNNYKNLIIRPEHILSADKPLIDSYNTWDNKDFYNNIFKENKLFNDNNYFIMEKDKKTTEINEFELYQYLNFNGSVCDYFAYRVDFRGVVRDYCKEDKYKIFNILEDKFFFRKLEIERKTICTMTCCQCLYLQENKKKVIDEEKYFENNRFNKLQCTE